MLAICKEHPEITQKRSNMVNKSRDWKLIMANYIYEMYTRVLSGISLLTFIYVCSVRVMQEPY